MRIGHGFDVHAFAPRRRLVLCGVEIAHERGMAAHSDGDVPLHALCDALLGAAGLGDIGRHFPDSSAEFKDIDSRILLRRVAAELGERGMRPASVDITIVAQAPRLAPHIDSMCSNVAGDLHLPRNRVNVKATTTEQLGFTGRREGIAAWAVALVEE